MAQVILKNVTKKYGNVVAISNLNLEIQDKEFLVLVGPSGCGKSTILRMIAGLESITSGKIYIGDELVNNVHPKDRDIAMVFQNYALYPHMSVYDNMAFGLKLRKYHKDEIKKRVNEAAQILGIENLLNRKPRQLSGGQRQRVAVGRAIVRKPKVFLFDEPLSNLDAKMRVQMRKEISLLHHRLKTTMIYVTHDQIEAMTMGTRIAVINKGIIQQVADPITLYKQPANLFVAGFIGSPPMNFIHGFIKKENSLYFTDNSFKININRDLSNYINKNIILGIRPEDITLGGDIKATVENIEPMGYSSYFYLKTESDQEITANINTDTIQIGDKINISFDLSKIHFFDTETEKRI